MCECVQELTTYFVQLFLSVHLQSQLPIKCVCVCINTYKYNNILYNMYVHIKRFDETFSSRFLFFFIFVNGLFKIKSIKVFVPRIVLIVLYYNNLPLYNIIIMLVCRSTAGDEKELNLKSILLITVKII